MAEENSITFEKIKMRRLDRMRMGQETCEILPLLSDPEIRVALVPLTEGQYDLCMKGSALIDVPENVAGAGIRDRHEAREVIVRSIREPDNLEQRVFNSVESMMEVLEPSDVTYLYDAYLEMQLEISPHISQLSEEEVDFLKGVWQSFPWKDLSGRQQYALNRFISTLSLEQLGGSLPGSTSITSRTTTKKKQKSTSIA